ncbi:MAG: Gldg family protein [Hyphomonadaceae bacterium]|nr:Gldg family protein [Hyphomonadaceae bacterium]
MIDRLTGRAWSLIVALLIVFVFVLANLALQPRLAGARMDFTQRKLFTLSDATRDALSQLAEPVDLTFVYSRRVGQDYPRIRAHAARVREMLDAYASASGGQLRIRQMDATPFSEAEDIALEAGLVAVPSQSGDPLYFGLIGRNSVDDQRIIAFLSPDQESKLEYDLTRMVARLDDPAPARVGLISSLQGMQGDGRETGYAVLRDLTRSYGLERIDPDFASLPDDLDVLVIAHPEPFNDYQAWLVDQFALRTGRLIWIVDPAAKIAAGGGSIFDLDTTPQTSGLGRFSRHWGLVLSEQAVADAGNALPVQTLSPDGRSAILGQPLFIATPPATMSRTDPITSELDRAVHFGAPGALSLTSNSPLVGEALISTGPAPSYIPADEAVEDMLPGDVIASYDTLSGPLTLAMRLSGRLTTAFPDGPPSLPLSGDPVTDELVRAETAETLPHIARSEKPAAMVVVADADFLDDGFYINPTGGAVIADNGALVLNSVDALTGIEGLLSLRSRAESRRPMTLVEKMRAEAEAEFLEEQVRLEDQLADRETELQELEADLRESSALLGDFEVGLSGESRARLQELRSEIVETRDRLRAIERDFRHDIDQLEGSLKAVNIWGGAALAVLLGLLLWWRGRRR